jgi:DNA-dependent metalloprotease WSS1
METLMDTMLHELCHNVWHEHDTNFYGLLEEIKQEWKLLSSKGYKGEGFFSQGQRLGSGHVFYKPSIPVSATDRRRLRDAADRRANGIRVGSQGRQLADGVFVGSGGPIADDGMTVGGRRLGGDEIFDDIDPKELAAMAAEQRAFDQKRCGAKQAGADMRRETERAQREGTKTDVRDIGKIIDLEDLNNYDLEDIPYATPITNDSAMSSKVWENPFQSDWMCSQCTFSNPPLYLSCQICQTERTLQGGTQEMDVPKESGLSWDCQACTFKNEDVQDGKCIVCGTEIDLLS